jgi:AraC-like DNA-binding protein/mannose-6-phosphate isomerase-like protein (cupin superfamily)
MRSTDAADFQDTPRPAAVMRKAFAAGEKTARHHHPRGQVLYAVDGLMSATTQAGAWAVPSGYALLIPPRLVHDVTMHGPVVMCTAYLVPEAYPGDRRTCRVVKATRLLDAVLRALAEEPVLYDAEGRGGHLAALLVDEIETAPESPFALALPRDGRLQKMCRALIETPSLPHDIDAWADRIGLSRRTLTRKFRSETGVSFGAWRRRLRLLHALRQEADGVVPSMAASRSGYRSRQALRAMMAREAGGRGEPVTKRQSAKSPART